MLNFRSMENIFLRIVILTVLLSAVFTSCSTRTSVEIKGEQFYLDGDITYQGEVWNENKVEGLLFNSRMVQGIFDDINPETRSNFRYPDTDVWDPDRNTNEFVEAMSDWRKYGLLSFTLNLQGGSPLGYGNNGWINSAFDPKGELKPAYMDRLSRILDRADELKMVVILGYFYFGQDEYLEDEASVVNAVDNITEWIVTKGYQNLLIEINNECDIYYNHEILKPARVVELINRVHDISGGDLLVSTSFSGGNIPTSGVIESSDFILLHANGIDEPSGIVNMVDRVRGSSSYCKKPIIFNEDDHYNFGSDDYNLKSAVEAYSSWGYFDFRRGDESYENGYQSVPVDWKISSKRKKAFFNKLREITGY